MSTLTIRLPEDTHARLRSMASQRGVSINKLMEELSTLALAQHDVETRFKAAVSIGSAEKGLAILQRIDEHFGTATSQGGRT